MSLVIPPGFAQVALRYRLDGDPEEMISTFGISVEGDGDAEAGSIVTTHNGQFLGASIATGWTFLGVTLRVGQDGGPPAVVELLSPTPGEAAPSSLPNNCAYLIRKQTALGGRAGRGRMYLPPFVIQEGVIDQTGLLEESDRADLEELISPVIFVRPAFLLHDSLSPTTTPTPITGISVQQRIATQRRRMRR